MTILPPINIFLSVLILLLSACSEKPLTAPMPPAIVQSTPDNWQAHQQQKQQEKAAYIRQHQVAYDWFADFPFSETDGTPYILLRLLPVLAPDLWGSEDNFLDVIGLFNDTRQPGYPVPRGVGISALSRPQSDESMDYSSFTCGACHIGRVVTDNGTLYLDGGVNAEFNLVAYRVKVFQTFQQIAGIGSDITDKNESLVRAVLAALEQAQASSPHFFYNNYQQWDTDYEAKQIALFKAQAQTLIPQFAKRVVDEYEGYAALLKKNYAGFEERSLAGFPGMADATGISTINGYNKLKQGVFTQWFASLALPPTAGITDFMTVWEQGKRKAEWDEKHQRLVNGGGQWNGNIPIPMYRNLAAQLTLGLNNNDIRVSAFGVELLDGLPATVYPFDVDIELAKKGEKLFVENCAQCHQPYNGKVYSELGVNLDRSRVVNWIIRKGGIDGFFDACAPATTVVMDGESRQPCAEFAGVSLEGKKQMIISPNSEHHGYNARPLSGVWAQAPYLHNGSVPSVYHLLVPRERPVKFMKSHLEYDQKHLGFRWQLAGTQTLVLSAPESSHAGGYMFDNNAFPALSNKGHDNNIREGDVVYKLDWSDDKAGAWALIEYLKTL